MADLTRTRRFRPLPQYGDLKSSLVEADHEGWMLADGRVLLRSAYPALFAVLGIRFGATNGATFRLPDLRGRTLVMASEAHPLGMTGGQEAVALAGNHLPEHSHGVAITSAGGTVRLNLPVVQIGTDVLKTLVSTPSATAKAGATSPEPVPTLPPYCAVNLFVYAGA